LKPTPTKVSAKSGESTPHSGGWFVTAVPSVAYYYVVKKFVRSG